MSDFTLVENAVFVAVERGSPKNLLCIGQTVSIAVATRVRPTVVVGVGHWPQRTARHYHTLLTCWLPLQSRLRPATRLLIVHSQYITLTLLQRDRATPSCGTLRNPLVHQQLPIDPQTGAIVGRGVEGAGPGGWRRDRSSPPYRKCVDGYQRIGTSVVPIEVNVRINARQHPCAKVPGVPVITEVLPDKSRGGGALD